MEKIIPDNLKDVDKWSYSRRKFLKSIAIAGIAAQIPFLSACWNEEQKGSDESFPLESIKTIKAVQLILFPDDGFGPDASSINASDYFQWALHDQQMNIEDKKFIINGIEWTTDLSMSEYTKPFYELETKQQKLLIIKMTALDWGETWLSVIMSFILEALLSNPIYGGNTNMEGWKWLKHYSGSPQPNVELSYPQIFTTLEQSS